MVKMINKSSGTEMYVHESRVDEYLEAGHKLASNRIDKAKVKQTSKPEKKTTKKN